LPQTKNFGKKDVRDNLPEKSKKGNIVINQRTDTKKK
jgi:hypothetical protein